jgi:hypothetical protein
MQDLIEALKKKDKQNNLREKDLPIIKNSLSELKKITNLMEREIFPSVLWPAKGIQAFVILRGIKELNQSIVLSLEKKLYGPVESLFRVSIENSINVIYIFEDQTINRSRGYLKQSINELERKSKARIERASRENDITDRIGIDLRISFAQLLKEENPKLFIDDNLIWPSAFERFKAIGHEKSYRNLYATTSDAIHSMSEDVINCLVEYNSPREFQELIANVHESYRKSFSIYLSLWALELYSEALYAVSESLNGKLTERIETVRLSIIDVLVDHEEEHFERVTSAKAGQPQGCP